MGPVNLNPNPNPRSFGLTLTLNPLPASPQVFHAPPAANTTNGEGHPIPTGGRPQVNPNPGRQVMGPVNPNPNPNPRSFGLTRTLNPLLGPPQVFHAPSAGNTTNGGPIH